MGSKTCTRSRNETCGHRAGTLIRRENMAQIETASAQGPSTHPWMDRFLTMIMVAGGVATVAWIAAMLMAGWQMAVALMGVSAA